MNSTHKGFGAVGVIVAVAVVLVLGGVLYFSGDNAMETQEGAMMETTETASGEVMQKEGSSSGTMTGQEGSMVKNSEGTVMESKPTTTQSGEMMEQKPSEGAMMKEKGTYESYSPSKLALANKGDVVLFFHADWCPVCRALESEIQKDITKIPDGVHILKVNYDNEVALKQKYGVTTQHTFVQVNADGSLVGKWSNATTLAAVLGNIK